MPINFEVKRGSPDARENAWAAANVAREMAISASLRGAASIAETQWDWFRACIEEATRIEYNTTGIVHAQTCNQKVSTTSEPCPGFVEAFGDLVNVQEIIGAINMFRS